MDNKKIIWGIIAIIAIVLFWQFGNKKIEPIGTIKIGAVMPLSGSRADAGEQGRQGLMIAKEEINKDSSRAYKIELLFEDSKYEPQAAVAGLKKLIDVDSVKYVIGAYGSSETLAIAPIAEQQRVILITPASQSDAITKAGDYIFRLMHNTAQEAPFIGPFITDRMKSNELHFIGIKTEVTPSYIKNITPVLERANKKVGLIEEFDTKASDFRTQLIKIKSKNPTDIFIIAQPAQVGLILKQANDLDMYKNVQYYSLGTEGSEIVTVGGKLVDGLIYTFSYDAFGSEKQVVDFHQKFLKIYNREPDGTAANAYDALYLLSDCFEKVGNEVDNVKSCLYETKNRVGASGIFSIDENGDAQKNLIIKTIRDGKFVKYE
jgi:branched-chain amino acid transport system substrate-binding protein